MLDASGPWGTGPYKLVEGSSLPHQRSNRVVLEANLAYWDPARFPRLNRIIFDNTPALPDAVELVKTHEGRVDLVTGLRPLDTLRVAQSPFATVVKNRGALTTVFGMFNMRKAASPWRDVRLRQAVNYAINRPDLIRYAAKGNGVIIPALVPRHGFGYAPDLTPYPFDPAKTQQLRSEAGYPDGMALTLIAPEHLAVQITVVGKMLEHSGFRVTQQVLDTETFHTKVFLSRLDAPPEHQSWDIALTERGVQPFAYIVYRQYALDGPYDWVVEHPELLRLYTQYVHTVDQEAQQALIRQMLATA